MKEYIPTIGLEIHAELRTQTKMFCHSKNDPDEVRPNVNVCPVCMGHPGTLPVVNKEAVQHIRRTGRSLGGTVAKEAAFVRKNYFYPDLPKGYQISQYKLPLVSGGLLCGVAITRIHLEEDTARLVHSSPFEGGQGGCSFVDFNRAGVPLMELVTEPVITSAKAAADFARELQLLLRYLGASRAHMEKGEMRVEANVSVSEKLHVESGKLGTKVEVKNLNSFRSVERAIAYEVERQRGLLERGESVLQETRGWNDTNGETFSQRVKEESHDYRYFPEPDLPVCSLEGDAGELPELPWERRARYTSLGFTPAVAELFVSDRILGDFYDTVVGALGSKEKIPAAHYLASDVAGLRAETESIGFGKLESEAFVEVVRMAASGEISSRGAKDILRELFVQGGKARAVAETKNLFQQSDAGALARVADKVLAAHPAAVADYHAGKVSTLQFLVGQGMKEMRGAAHPEKLAEALKNALKHV